jgi:predicted DNA binding protein
MTHYEITFRIQYDSPFGRFTSTHQRVSISQWCNWHKDYIEIGGLSSIDKEIQEDIQDLAKNLQSKIIRKSLTKSALRIVFGQCNCTKVISPPLMAIDRFNCLVLQPYIFQQGSELCRVIAFSQTDIKKLFANLDSYGKIEVLSRRKVDADVVRDNLNISRSNLFGGLTSKQKTALQTALDIGYYKKPRGANATKVAKAMRIPRSSFVDHLRKAENKILNSLHPFISLEAG